MAALLSLFVCVALPCAAAFAESGEPIYTAYMSRDGTIRETKNRQGKSMGGYKERQKIEIYAVDPEWVTVKVNGREGYVLRTVIDRVEPIDPEKTPPYGVEKFLYTAVVKEPVEIHYTDTSHVTLQKGARVSIISVTDGMAKIISWRRYSYIDTRSLESLTPVSCTDVPYSTETPIATYTSYYSTATDKANIGRIENIRIACEKLTRIVQPGEVLNFNTDIGPFSRKNGYQEAPILIDGETKIGFGGGTCQVSSTFYNVALQLPGVTIDHRNPHGPSGAKYLPHGVDAAVGTDVQNLIIINAYDFPIRIEASAQDGALFMCVYRVQ